MGRVGSSVASIKQALVLAANDKRAKLEQLLEVLELGEKTIVFAQKKRSATWVCRELRKAGHRAEDIHGDRPRGDPPRRASRDPSFAFEGQ